MKTIKYLSMAALALVGAMTVSCSSDDNVIDQAQTATKNNVVTQTVTIGFDEQAATRALAIDYGAKTLTKTFEADDQIAVIYENESNELVKATVTIAAGDISTNSKSAKFTVSMTNPKASGTLKYIYPAAMAGATDVDYTKLNSQDGTLATLASNLDLAVFEGTLTAASELPASASLENKLAILALTIKNSDGTNDLTNTITGMTLSDGTNSYSITGKDDDGHIYAAIQPTTAFSCIATNGTNNYTKAVTGKNYAADNIYNLGLKMTDASVVSLKGFSDGDKIKVSNGQTITGMLTDNEDCLIYATITIEDGAIVTLKDVVINPDGNYTSGSDISGITCEGNATIILEGTNTVNGFDRSGIEVKSGKTLTILGTGTLNASGYSGAGIGGEGNIVIMGGTINATGTSGAAGIGGRKGESCGNITISGGTINATGGSENGLYGAGIGGGASYSIDNTTSITITSGVEKVTATRGGDAGECKFIGAGSEGHNGATVTIDGVADPTATTSSELFPNFNSVVSGNTWTLTHK